MMKLKASGEETLKNNLNKNQHATANANLHRVIQNEVKGRHYFSYIG